MKRDGVSMPHLNENYNQGKVQETYSYEPLFIFDADSMVSLKVYIEVSVQFIFTPNKNEICCR